MQTAYDFFEDCVEAALPALSALMVRLSSAEGFSIRLMMQDGASCLTLFFPAGGEQP